MRGRHRSPDRGACVMELASMLAGEPFSDAPECVEPVLAAYLRALNDRLGHHDRQRLLPYAAAVVGTTRAGAGRACRDRCLLHACASRRATRPRLFAALGLNAALHANTGAGEWAARASIARGDLDGALALLDELLRLAGATPPGLEPAPLALPVGRLAQVG